MSSFNRHRFIRNVLPLLAVSDALRRLYATTTATMSTAALCVSTGFIAAVAAAACAGRRYIGRLVKPGLVQELFYEAVAAAELCACCFELIISAYATRA